MEKFRSVYFNSATKTVINKKFSIENASRNFV